MNQNDMLAEALKPTITTTINDTLKHMDISQQIRNQLEELTKDMTKVLTVKRLDGTMKKLGATHEQFEELFETVTSGENVLLFGGAGVGKTSSVVKIADALGLGLRSISFSSQTTQTNLIGFIDAHGVYHASPLIEAAISGDICLLDEFDAGQDGVILAINSLIDNGFIDTPNGMVHVHDNFRIIACANTNLNGATAKFSGRRKLDAATQDRFAVIEYKFDKKLVQTFTQNDAWYNLIMKVKEVAENAIDDMTITPRVFYKGSKGLRATKNSFEKICNQVLFKGIDSDGRMIMQNVLDNNMDLIAQIESERPMNQNIPDGKEVTQSEPESKKPEETVKAELETVTTEINTEGVTPSNDGQNQANALMAETPTIGEW